MGVGLNAGNHLWSIGTGKFFHAFFSTVTARLEPDGWGTRFPAVMKELYRGELDPESAELALAELDRIRAELRRFPPSDVVWDAADRARRPPWGDEIAEDITDLSNYFVTDEGQDLFDVLTRALGYATRAAVPVRVQ